MAPIIATDMAKHDVRRCVEVDSSTCQPVFRKLVADGARAALAIERAQLALQMHGPYLRAVNQAVAVKRQAVDDSFQHRLGSQRPMERSLRLERGRLLTGHAGGKQQRPQAVVSTERANGAFDPGHQAQALTVEAEAARHGHPPLEDAKELSLEERAAGGRGHGLRIEGIEAMPHAS